MGEAGGAGGAEKALMPLMQVGATGLVRAAGWVWLTRSSSGQTKKAMAMMTIMTIMAMEMKKVDTGVAMEVAAAVVVAVVLMEVRSIFPMRTVTAAMTEDLIWSVSLREMVGVGKFSKEG